ncbi:MAG: DSD1 family PLP-dependent enzyme [Pseudomonadota bacterium]
MADASIAAAALAEIDTPSLVIDLDAMDRNIARMAREAAAAGIRLRPHAKTHKCAEIARRQVEAGAVGVACQTLGEAEAMVAGGIADVLITNQIVAPRKLARVAALAGRARLGICVDAAGPARALSAVASAAGTEIGVLVEIDVGQGRCGIAPGADAAGLAAEVASLAGLRLEGLQAYHGAAQHFRTPADRAVAIARAGALTSQTVDALAAAGLQVGVVGGAGTGSYPLEATSGIWTEIQPGSYLFMDADYARNTADDRHPPFEHALFVLAEVISRRPGGHAVLDAGHKASAIDSGVPVPHGLADAEITQMSDEHAVLSGADLSLGERLLLVPGHIDPTVNLHDRMVGVRGLGTAAAQVERVFTVDARGAMR